MYSLEPLRDRKGDENRFRVLNRVVEFCKLPVASVHRQASFLSSFFSVRPVRIYLERAIWRNHPQGSTPVGMVPKNTGIVVSSDCN